MRAIALKVRVQHTTYILLFGVLACSVLSGCDKYIKKDDFAKKVECAKLYDSGFLHFQQEWPIGSGREYENAQAEYGFYSHGKNRCVIKIVSASPEPHKSAVWFYGSLENSVIISFDDSDSGASRRDMWNKADQAEADLRK